MFRSADIDGEVARSYPVSQSPAKCGVALTFGADRGELRRDTENDKFAELDAIWADLAAEFIECSLDGRCLGDGMAAALGGHELSVTLVRHRLCRQIGGRGLGLPGGEDRLRSHQHLPVTDSPGSAAALPGSPKPSIRDDRTPVVSDFVHDRLQFEFPGVGSLAMKIDEADMASATDVGRNTGRYVSEAADGRRIVIMNNHQPVAAIIGMADLRRLDALDIPVAGIAAQTPAQKVTLADLDIRPDWIPVGLTRAGHTAHINPLQHLLVAGKGASDMIGPLLAGVVEDGLDTAFVVASEQPVVIAYPEGRLPHVVSLATSLDIANEERVAEQIAGELDARSDLLRRHSVNTIDQYRRFNHDAGIIDHLIVVIDTADSVLGRQHGLSKVVDDIVQRGAALGASVWLFSPTATRHVIDACDAIEQRIALTTRTAIESRDIIGCADAADLTAGQAILQTRPGALTPITTFIRDDSLPPRPLEAIGPLPFGE